MPEAARSILEVLEQYDEQRTGQLPRELLRRVLWSGPCPEGRGPALEQFLDRALDRFRAPNSQRVPYGPLVEWLLDDSQDERLTLDAVLTRAYGLREDRLPSLTRRDCEAEDRPPSLTSSGQDCEWRIKQWLRDSVAPVVADALTAPLKSDRDLEFSFAQAIGFMEEDYPGQGKQIVLDLLQEGNVLERLATDIVASARKLTGTKAATASELNHKFASSEGTFELSYGEADDFFSGLEDLVGSPNPKVRTTMESEHCDQSDSQIAWTTHNYGVTTTSEIEWHFVVDPDQWCPNRTWPAETRSRTHPRKAEPLSHFTPTCEGINKRLEQPLSTEEWIGARLYTGPMFEKYNAVNRGGAKCKGARERQNDVSKKQFATLCGDNRYCTTIHVINSALIKLSKLECAGTVYRGISRGVLPPCFLHNNKAGVRGGVEFGFLSTSKKREVAMEYANFGEASTVLEIGTGMIDRGANLAPISQYPHEEEICFPPLACMEVVGSKVEGSVLVVEVRLNVNFTAPTIERVIGKRLGVIESMCDNLRLETRANLSNPLWKNVQNKDEATGAQVLELVEKMAAADLKSVTAVAKNQPELFNDDVTFLDAMKTALDISDAVKWQASRVLRRAAAELEGRGSDGGTSTRNLRRATSAEEVDMIAHIKQIADDHEKVEWKEMAPIEVKREQTAGLGLGLGSTPGHILDILRLVQQEGVIQVAKPCALWPDVQPDWQLATVNGKVGEPTALAKGLVSERTVSVVFRRPLETEELNASLLQMLGGAEDGDTEETALLVGRCLALNRSLHTVNLWEKSVGPKACAVLARVMEDNRTVDSLFFGRNETQLDTALALGRALGANHSLGTLNIETGSFGAQGGEAIANGLRNNGTLHTLRIRKTELGKDGGRAVAETLCTNSSLKVLYIENNDLGPEGASEFGEALTRNRTLGQLHMDNNNLGPVGGEAIAGALQRNEKIHTLFVKQNSFGEPGGRAFAEMLRTNKTLRVLGINSNSLGPSGVAIAQALAKNNRSLQSLSIDDNGLGYEFAEAIAEVIRDNREFQTLNMGDNQIGPGGAEVLALALEMEGSSTLLRLEVHRNNLGPQGALAFARALRSNKSLNRLDISHNQLTEEAGRAIAETFLANAALGRLAVSQSEVGEQAVSRLRETFKDRQLELY